jgi:hypothetical protein
MANFDHRTHRDWLALRFGANSSATRDQLNSQSTHRTSTIAISSIAQKSNLLQLIFQGIAFLLFAALFVKDTSALTMLSLGYDKALAQLPVRNLTADGLQSSII